MASVYGVSVKKKAVFNANYYPKDMLVDFETPNASVQFPLVQTQKGELQFYYGRGAQFNDDYYVETTDEYIDEDRNGGTRYDFAHSLGTIGTYLITDLIGNDISGGYVNFDRLIQPTPTGLTQTETLFGNGPVGNPEVRHYKVMQSGNVISGALGTAYPYKIALPAVSDGTQKWKDLQITWALALKSVFNYGRWTSGTWDLGDTQFRTFKAFQKAVAVTKLSGNVIANNTSIQRIATQAILLSKSSNRGDGVTSVWIVQKKSGNSFVNATDGVDYSLNTGTLNSDQIEIQFLLPGEYKIVNYCQGNSSATSGPNEGFSNLLILIVPNQTSITVNNTLTLPFVNPLLTPVNAFTNVTKETSPILTGYENYNVIVTPVLDLSGASYIKETITVDLAMNSTTSVTEDIGVTLTNAQWLQTILQFAKVKCVLRKKDTLEIVDERDCNATNSYQHTFSANDGLYEAGYIVTPIQ